MAIIVSISTIPRMLQPTNLIFFFFYSISYFIFSICSWVRPEYFLIRLMSTPSASMFLAISKAFSFLPSCFAVSIEFLISRYAILLASYVLWIQIRHVLQTCLPLNKLLRKQMSKSLFIAVPNIRLKPKSVSKLMYLSSTCFIRNSFNSTSSFAAKLRFFLETTK